VGTGQPLRKVLSYLLQLPQQQDRRHQPVSTVAWAAFAFPNGLQTYDHVVQPCCTRLLWLGSCLLGGLRLGDLLRRGLLRHLSLGCLLGGSLLCSLGLGCLQVKMTARGVRHLNAQSQGMRGLTCRGRLERKVGFDLMNRVLVGTGEDRR